MSNWVKWWKNKTFLKILGISLLAMGISFGIAMIDPGNTWCAVGSILVACGGGLVIRKVIIKKLDELAEENTPESK
jgi:hypothetical protein